MNRLTPFKLALILGAGTEVVLVGLGFAFGRFGPCGPANVFSGLLMLLHLPGLLFAAPIGEMESVRPGTEAIRDTLAGLFRRDKCGDIHWAGIPFYEPVAMF